MLHSKADTYWFHDNSEIGDFVEVVTSAEKLFRQFANSFTEAQLDVDVGGCDALRKVADNFRTAYKVIDCWDDPIPWCAVDAQF